MRLHDLEPIHSAVYRTLQDAGLVSNKADYARSYLGRGRNYLHGLGNAHKEPSREVYQHLRDRLASLADNGLEPTLERRIRTLVQDIDELLSSHATAGRLPSPSVFDPDPREREGVLRAGYRYVGRASFDVH